MPKVAISKTRARLLAYRAEQTIEIAKAMPTVPPDVQLARDHFPSFCTRMGRPPAEHMGAWHKAFVTGESNDDLVDIAGPPTAILSPRGPLPLGTGVWTPGGVKQLGKLEVGDLVFDETGCPTPIEALVHFEPRPTYAIAHDDGAILYADGEHDLLVRNERRVGSPWRRRQVKEILALQKRWQQIRFASPLPEPLQHPEASLPLHPYLLGVLLVRSSSRNGGLRVTARRPAVRRLELYVGMLPKGVEFRPIVSTVEAWSLSSEEEGGSHPVRGWMKALGLWGVPMAKRFLPERYLAGSIEQRLELLRGLCDHRGRLRRGGRVRLSLPSEPLVDGVVLLVRSLGGRVDRRGCVSRRTIEFILPARMVPFGVRDLAEPYRQEWSADLARRCLVRRIRSIAPTGHAEAVGCVSVRSASATFVTVDGLVSCNSAKSTVLGLLLAWAIGRHAMVGRLLRILYVSYSLPVSRGKSATIKNTIQSKAYQEVFPMVALSKDATSNELWSIDYHKADIDVVGEDAFTVAATGILGSIASKRANLVCPDDLIKSRNAIKKLETRQEMEKNWLEVIEPTMFEGSRVFSLGTRFHSGDIFGTTFTEEHGWQVLRQKALLYDEDGTPRSYWPERFTTEFLLKKQLKNEFIFSYQFQNEAIQSNEAGMSEGLIVKGEVPDQYDELAVSIDLSAGMSERNDFTVMTLAGIADDVCYLIDFRRLKAVGNIEKLNALCELLWEWNVLGRAGDDFTPTSSDVVIVPEQGAYQNSFKGDFESVLLGERGLYNLNVRGIPNSGDKMTHLRAAVGLMQRRKIVFNRFRRWDVYTNEILHFGYTDHDDCVDGLTLLTRHWRRRLGAEVW
jgi:hypothetical protein